MHETMTIDITPESLKDPKTAAQVQRAMESFTDATAAVANEATGFLDQWGTELMCAVPTCGDDLNDLNRTIRARYEAQEALLRAIAARPGS